MVRRITPIAAALVVLGAPAGIVYAAGFDQPAQPLAQALSQFTRQAGLQLLTAPELLRGQQAQAIQGARNASEAVGQMLRGTGLHGRIDGRTLVIEAAPSANDVVTLSDVKVTAQAERAGGLPEAYAGGQVARGGRLGMLGNKDFMETPFSVSSYTEQTAANLQATTVADVLVNDPSVGLEGSKLGWLGNFNIRGFTVQSNDTTINGIGGIYPQNLHIPIEFVERVDVLRGPSALVSGMAPFGAISGLVNIETKRAAAEPLSRLGIGYTSDSVFGIHVDLGRRFGEDKAWGIRFNGAVDGGDTVIDGMSAKRRLGSLGLDYAGRKIRFSLDAFTLDAQFDGGSSLSAQLSRTSPPTSVPDAPKNSTNVFKGLESHSKADMVLARGEYDLNDNWTVHAGMGYSQGKSLKGSTGNLVTNVNAAGDYSGSFWTTPSIRKSKVYFAGLNGRFSTGEITHQPAVNVQRIDIDNFYQGANSASWAGNLYDPVDPPVAMRVLGSPPKTGETVLQSVAVADTMGFFDERLQLTLGVRRQNVKAKTFNGTTGALASEYDASATTPMAAVVGRINTNWSAYANYAEGLTQGTTVGTGYNNSGEMLAPYKTKQYEAGVKWDAGTFANTFSIFQITRPSNISDASTAPLPTYRMDGEQRNRGVEWQFFGQAAEGLRILGGVVYTQAELTRTQGGLTDGKTATGAPKWRATVGLEHDLAALPGVTLSGRWTHASAQYADTNNLLKVDAWNRFDAGVRYGTRIGGKKVSFYANVENVADKSYWEAASPRALVINAPRTLKLSAVIDF